MYLSTLLNKILSIIHVSFTLTSISKISRWYNFDKRHENFRSVTDWSLSFVSRDENLICWATMISDCVSAKTAYAQHWPRITLVQQWPRCSMRKAFAMSVCTKSTPVQSCVQLGKDGGKSKVHLFLLQNILLKTDFKGRTFANTHIKCST
jgi:hypothetical protein